MPGPEALTNPWLAGAEIALPIIAGGISGGEQQANARKDREQRWRELMAQLQVQREQLASTNATKAVTTGAAQASIPLMDQAFSGLQSRFAAGPTTFGHQGDQNRALAAAAAAYQPNQNPSINAYNDVLTQAMNRFGINPRTFQG